MVIDRRNGKGAECESRVCFGLKKGWGVGETIRGPCQGKVHTLAKQRPVDDPLNSIFYNI